jgi:hypothetical protein
VAGVRWEPVARLRRRMLPGVLLALGLPALASCSTAARTGQGTVTGMIADNGGPPRQGGGQACGGTVPPVNICLQPDTISFVSVAGSRTIYTTGRFRVKLPPGDYRVNSRCESTSVVVLAGQTATVNLWCQIR